MAEQANRNDEYIRTRRRLRHKAHRVASGASVRTISVDVAQLAWQREAACLGVDPEAFFPDGAVSGMIMRLCGSCPVIEPCLNYALSQPKLHGIWAGTTESQRASMQASASSGTG